MTRYFFDISDIAIYIRAHRSISGIQRATVMIISEIARICGSDAVYLAWHSAPQAPYLTCPAHDLLDALRRFDTVSLGRVLGVPVAQQILEAAAQVSSPSSLSGGTGDLATLEDIRITSAKPETPRGCPFFDVARRGDVLCGLGRGWGQPHLEQSFRRAQAHGLSTHVLVHDLVPLKLPHLANPASASGFYSWLSGSPAFCDSYLVNSQATERDLQAFLRELAQSRPVHVTPLAQAPVIAPGQIAPPSDSPAPFAQALTETRTLAALSPPVREAATLPFALCVGTIEPRKNLWRLVQAWAQLAREPGLELPRLVLAGRRGWLTDGFLEMLERTGGMGGWVTYLDAPEDHELDHLYRRCLFTTKVSFYEGWGLPIGEGLSYGKTGVVSQTSSMPEVGGDMVEYCNPHSITSIAAACRKLAADPAHRRALEARIADTTLRGWNDVAQDVLGVLT